MPAYLISGPSGSGKTTVGQYLAKLGYTVIETDHEPGLSGYFHNNTGKKAPELLPYPLPQEWLDTYSWNWDPLLIRELFNKSEHEIIFFCGGAHNESDFFNDFQLRFALATSNNTLKERLQVREPERWVENSAELQRQYDWNNKFIEYSKRVGAIVVDSSQPPDKIAKDIIEKIKKYDNK